MKVLLKGGSGDGVTLKLGHPGVRLCIPRKLENPIAIRDPLTGKTELTYLASEFYVPSGETQDGLPVYVPQIDPKRFAPDSYLSTKSETTSA